MVVRSEFPAILCERRCSFLVTLQIKTFTRLLEDIDCLEIDDMENHILFGFIREAAEQLSLLGCCSARILSPAAEQLSLFRLLFCENSFSRCFIGN
ncbi:hypothetical protein ACROYT_G034035 [Oculina patagonica]